MKSYAQIRSLPVSVLTLLVIVSSLTFVAGCGTAAESNYSGTEKSGINEGEKHFAFLSGNDEWKVVFRNEKISELFKNGEKIPPGSINEYKDFVYENLPGYKNKHLVPFVFKDPPGNDSGYFFDFKILDDSLLSHSIEGNMKKFRIHMDKMKDKLSDLSKKKIKIKIDREKLQRDIEKMNEELDKIGEFEIDINYDGQDFPPAPELNFEISFPDNYIGNEDDDENVRKFKFNLKKHSDDAYNMSNLISALKEEMKKDGYILNDSEEIDIEFKNDRILINGEELKGEKHEKYSKILKEHSGKDKNAKVKIRINEK